MTFCAAERLTNASKHSQAAHICLDVAGGDDMLTVHITDDGIGGAEPASGTGLRGLAQRIGTSMFQMGVTSPPSGPTDITVELPVAI